MLFRTPLMLSAALRDFRILQKRQVMFSQSHSVRPTILRLANTRMHTCAEGEQQYVHEGHYHPPTICICCFGGEIFL